MSPMTGSTPIARSTSASAGVRTRPRTRRPAFAAKRQMLEPSNPLAPVTRTSDMSLSSPSSANQYR